VRGERACVGSQDSILHNEVTDALELLHTECMVDVAEIQLPDVLIQDSIVAHHHKFCRGL
jgi:hypothetical protein